MSSMTDFNDDEELDDENYDSTNLQLGNNQDKKEEFRLDDDDDDDEDEEGDEDIEIEKLRREAKRIDAEAERLRELQNAIKEAKAINDADSDAPSMSHSIGSARGSPRRSRETSLEPADADARSIFAKNVHYNSSDEDVKSFFASCGAVARVTILKDKVSGRPKGCAYIQFHSKEAVEVALTLNGSMFKGRPLTLAKKHPTLPMFKLRRRRRRRRRFNPYYAFAYGYGPYYPRRRRRSWAPY